MNTGEIKDQNSKRLNKWFMFPDTLPNQRYGGFENRDDETQNRGKFPIGQNITFNSARIPTLRTGYETLGTSAADATPVKRAWFFENRDGVQYELKTYDTFVDYWITGVSTEWLHLLTGLTSGLEFGYANIGESSAVTTHTNFCNGTDAFYRFNGAYGLISSSTATTITRNDGQTWYAAGFKQQNMTIGDSTSRFDITNLGGNTFRYTYDGTGTDPGISLTTVPIGMTVIIAAQNFNTTNNGTFITTGGGANYFEVTNTAGVAENDKTLGTGSLQIDNGYSYVFNVVINNTVYRYTGGCLTATLIVSTDPTGEAAGSIVVQQPDTMNGSYGNEDLGSVKSNVISAHDGRLHVRNNAKKSVWFYSKLDDPYDFTASAADAAGGAKEVEFGGPIISFGKLFKTCLCFKKRIIKALSFNQVGTRLDSPVYTTLISSDDKGTSLGAVNQKSTFSTPMGMVFVTPDDRMVLLTGVTANTEPQYLFLSDTIQPLFNQGVHDEGAGICVDNIVWYSFKSDINSTFNDVVIRGDMTRQSVTADGKIIPILWDTPYVGWNVADWTAVYNESLGSTEVHWFSATNSDAYRIVTDKADNNLPYTATLRTWNEHFDLPENHKKIDYIFLEMKLTENTELLLTILYDEGGVTAQEQYVLKGDGTAYKFDTSVYNPFGASTFGSQKIGSNPNSGNLKKYRFYLETPNNTYFYNISLDFAVSKEANDFELIRHGFRLTEYLEKPEPKLLKAST